ncbi:MAG: GMC family oxidoreductase [Bacteroidia bacterium]
MTHYDFDLFVIGAGSAGCVLASRLSEDPNIRVLLLEAGPPDRSPWIHLPIGYGKTMWNPKLNWCFRTDPDPNMNGRRIYWPRGKTLGGSSSINGLIYIRGQSADYDHWEELGNKGWSYADALPYFVKSEQNQRGANAFHGDNGPLKVSDIEAKHPLIEAFIASANASGIPRNEDFNGRDQEGVGYYQLTTWKGWRCSTATAYITPNRGRQNMAIECNAHVTQIIIEHGRAVGVRYRQNDHEKIVKIQAKNGEILVSAGAIQSPQLLQLSGIGPARLLTQHGIPVVADRPGVGENLQDHLQIRLIYECKLPITTNDQLRSWFGKFKMGLQWLLFRSGPIAVGINQGGCFMRALPEESETPDIQFHVATLSADMAGGKVHDFSGFTISICQLRPESRGYIRIKNNDAMHPPELQPNYLATARDRRTILAGIRAARRIASSAPIKGLIAREVKPGIDCQSDDEILDFVRNEGATIFHPSGTCKMGVSDDSMAVLDERLRVRGVRCLRVIDCSAMPTLVSGNTNAPIVMMAEKAVDMILEDRRLDIGAA